MEKKKSGRTRGVVSYAAVTLEELNRLLQPAAEIPVARRFVEMLKLQGRAITGNTETMVALSSATTPFFEAVKFDNNDEEIEPLVLTPSFNSDEVVEEKEEELTNCLDSFS